MSYTRDYAAAAGWRVLELVRRPPNKGYVLSGPISEGDVKNSEIRDARRALKALRAAGVPPDKELGSFQIEHLKQKCGGRSLEPLYVLKCKPGGWRLYFYVEKENKTCIGLHAVYKKTWTRDNDDYATCCSRLEELRKGGVITPLTERFLDG